MWGVTFRQSAGILFAALVAAMLSQILNPIVTLFNAPDHWLTAGFLAISENALFVFVLSAMLAWLAAALVRGGVGE